MFAWARLLHKKTRRQTKLWVEVLEDRTVPSLLGQQLFPADNPWNQRISNAPVAANSTAIMNNIISRYGDGVLHPDFSQDFRNGNALYGIPFNIVHGNSTPKVTVVLGAYADESDIVPAPIPSNAVLENDYQNGPRYGLNNRGDSHLLVWDVDNNVAYEFYRASRPNENADGQWHAAHETVWDMKTNTFRTLSWTSADAAGLSILAGLARPDEALPVSQGGQGVINHAIRFTLENDIILDQFLYPASHTANPGNNNPAVQPPMGARFRLKAGVDISLLNPQSRIIAQAMKDYGMIVADNGSNFFISGASSSVDANNQLTLTWNNDDVHDWQYGLRRLRFSDFEVVDLTPMVTDLSVHTGQAGTAVTVIGQNFSGAAGHLQVFFGTTPASSVTFVDDSQLLVAAPAGTGTVDVRVQSGITTAPNADNIKNPIFGYGLSAVTTGDRFTYGASSKPVPVVGDWNGTGREKAGGFRDGQWILDSNGSGSYDGSDWAFAYGQAGDIPVVGDWNGNGRDKIGVFRDGLWILDSNGTGVYEGSDWVFAYGRAGYLPVVGDWNGDGRDDVGVFRNGWWILDSNGSRRYERSDWVFAYGLAGYIPVVGDWNGDGRDDVGIFRNGWWILDSNGSRRYEASDRVFAYGQAAYIPVVGDWNGGKRGKIGVFRNGLWILDSNGTGWFDANDWVFTYG